jgi:ABC-type amino acid transport substrate-binding protein
VADRPACEFAILRHSDQNLSTLSAPFTIEPIGIAVSANELSLQSLLDNYIEAFRESGLIEQLQVRWLENDAWISQIP